MGLAIYDPFGNQVASASGAPQVASLGYLARQAGTYTLRLTASGNVRYVLTVTHP